MKRMKRLISVLLTLIMMLTVVLPAAAETAAGTYDITVKTKEAGHEYTAYQVFKGDVADNPNPDPADPDGKVLSNVEWGDDITNGDDLINALKDDDRFGKGEENLFKDAETASDVAKILKNVGDDTAIAIAFADVVGDGFIKPGATGKAGTYTTVPGKDTQGIYEIKGLRAGYYLVKDTYEGKDSTESMSRYMLEVVGNAIVETKVEKPDIDKKLYNANPNPDELGTGEIVKDDTNVAGIGQHVTYEITGTVPNYTGYDYYYYIIEDTLSKGLKFDNNVSITVDGVLLTAGTIAEDGTITAGDYYVYTEGTSADETGTKVRIAFADIMKFKTGAAIVVNYSALVTDDAKIGKTGNVNDAVLKYSNDPKTNYQGTSDEKKPGLPDEKKTPSIGESGRHITITYLTQLQVYKTEGEHNTALAGATFKLEGTSYQVIWEVYDKYTEAADGKWYKLKAKDENGNDTYTMDPPKPDQYTYKGVGDETTTTGYLKADDGTYYVPGNTGEYIGKDVYTLVKGNTDDYADCTNAETGAVSARYTKEEGGEKVAHRVEVPFSAEITTGESGYITFAGLGEGTYTLTETGTPAGYNTADPVTFTVKVTADGYPEIINDGTEKVEWSTDASPTVTWKDLGGGNYGFYTNVVNFSGTVLPSTGGMGTTILYIIGGILVVGAAVLLVTKKRMSSQKQ